MTREIREQSEEKESELTNQDKDGVEAENIQKAKVHSSFCLLCVQAEPNEQMTYPEGNKHFF